MTYIEPIILNLSIVDPSSSNIINLQADTNTVRLNIFIKEIPIISDNIEIFALLDGSHYIITDYIIGSDSRSFYITLDDKYLFTSNIGYLSISISNEEQKCVLPPIILKRTNATKKSTGTSEYYDLTFPDTSEYLEDYKSKEKYFKKISDTLNDGRYISKYNPTASVYSKFAKGDNGLVLNNVNGVYDTIEPLTGELTRRVGVKVLDETETVYYELAEPVIEQIEFINKRLVDKSYKLRSTHQDGMVNNNFIMKHNSGIKQPVKAGYFDLLKDSMFQSIISGTENTIDYIKENLINDPISFVGYPYWLTDGEYLILSPSFIYEEVPEEHDDYIDIIYYDYRNTGSLTHRIPLSFHTETKDNGDRYRNYNGFSIYVTTQTVIIGNNEEYFKKTIRFPEYVDDGGYTFYTKNEISCITKDPNEGIRLSAGFLQDYIYIIKVV